MGNRSYNGPIFVDVDLTRRCNLKCLGCRYHSANLKLKTIDDTIQDISMDLIHKLVKELPRLGTERVIFAGTGEPLLHPEFAQIISMFKSSQLEVRLFTNGLLLNRDRSLALIESGLDRLVVSLWATSAESYVQCHPGTNPENYSKIVKNIKRFTRLKEERGSVAPEVYLNHVCNVYTYKSIDDKIDLAHETGCDGILFTPFDPQSDEFKSAALSDEQVDLVLKNLPSAVKRMSGLGIKHNVDRIFLRHQFNQNVDIKTPCYIGRYQTRIRVDGAVMPCCYCNTLLGDLNKKSLGDIWNDHPYMNFRDRCETMEGLSTLMDDCSCDWCCYVGQNYRIHRIFKWLVPLCR
ncbi:MAG: radical SAM protein [Candidatus Aminicenantes bacterium]|jgi:MoaA/NifB/PqqE/SkfB family radical SAM enzyme